MANTKAIYAYGASSFTIWDNKVLAAIWDSGDDFERNYRIYSCNAFNNGK